MLSNKTNYDQSLPSSTTIKWVGLELKKNKQGQLELICIWSSSMHSHPLENKGIRGMQRVQVKTPKCVERQTNRRIKRKHQINARSKRKQ